MDRSLRWRATRMDLVVQQDELVRPANPLPLTPTSSLPYLITPDPRRACWWGCWRGGDGCATRSPGEPSAESGADHRAAVRPVAVRREWSRFVWNPNIAQPFIALWMLTGLLGYSEGRRWARIGHWLALSGAVQAHLGLASQLGPLSLLLVVLAWVRQPASAAR